MLIIAYRLQKQLSTLIKLSNKSRYLIEVSLVPTGEILCIVKVYNIDILSQNHIRVVTKCPSKAEKLWCTRRVKTTGSSPLVNFYQCTAKFYQCTAIFYQCTAKFYQSTDKFTSPLIKFSSAPVNLPVH